MRLLLLVFLAASGLSWAQIPGTPKFPAALSDTDLLCASNNYSDRVMSFFAAGSTTLQVTSSGNLCVPSLLAIGMEANGSFELVRVISKAGGVLTVIRAQDGTTAKAHQVGERVEARVAAEYHNTLARELKAIAAHVLTLQSGGGSGGPGIVWRGAWSSAASYALNDVVSYGGSSYIAVAAHTNSQPPSAFWNLFAAAGAGLPGADGTVWRVIAGVPAGTLGKVGDYTIDSTTGILYEKTGTSTQTSRGAFVAGIAHQLAADPAACPSGQYVRDVAADGSLTCSTPAGGSGNVSSVFGRTGAVSAGAGDYTVSQVTGAAPIAGPVFTDDPKGPTAAASDNDTSLATTAMVQGAIDAKTVTGTGTGDAYKFGRMGSDGVTAGLGGPISLASPITVSNAPSAITGTPCTTRDVRTGGYVASVLMRSTDIAGADVTGSMTVQFSTRAVGGSTWTNIGQSVLSSAATLNDSTLTGWTRTIAAGSELRVCVVSSSTVQHVVISPAIY